MPERIKTMSIFSETLIFLRQHNCISREQLADSLGVSVSHIKRLETDYIPPDEAMLQKIADYFSVTQAYLLGTVSRQITINEPGFNDLSRNFISVPVTGTEAAVKNKICESEILQRIIIPTPGNRRCDYIGILIDDECSVYGRIKHGDIAIVEISNQLALDDIVAVSYKEGAVFFRKYARLGPTIVLTSDCGFDNIIYDLSNTDYRIIGKVIAFHGKL